MSKASILKVLHEGFELLCRQRLSHLFESLVQQATCVNTFQVWVAGERRDLACSLECILYLCRRGPTFTRIAYGWPDGWLDGWSCIRAVRLRASGAGCVVEVTASVLERGGIRDTAFYRVVIILAGMVFAKTTNQAHRLSGAGRAEKGTRTHEIIT